MAILMQQLKRRAGLWGASAVVLAAAVATVLWITGRPAQEVPLAAVQGRVVTAPLRQPSFNAAQAMHLVATLRWGQPTAQPTPKQAATDQVNWDGYLSLDCGEIRKVEGLGLEQRRGEDGRASEGDRIGPVVVGEAGDQRVYWRSATASDWDGVRVTLDVCPPSTQRESGGSLKVVTPMRTYVARLAWSVDDFVSMPVGRGAFLDVHIAAERDSQALQRQRVTLAPVVLDKGDRQMAGSDEPPAVVDGGPAL